MAGKRQGKGQEATVELRLPTDETLSDTTTKTVQVAKNNPSPVKMSTRVFAAYIRPLNPSARGAQQGGVPSARIRLSCNAL